MKNEAESEILRRDLDAVLKKWRRVDPEAPKGGWIHNIRLALGMTVVDLAARLKIKPSSVTSMEQSEISGKIQMDTLRRAARAMGCNLVYALVPDKSLARVVENRRRQIARRELGKVIPLTGLVQPEYNDIVDAYAQTIKRKRLWEELE